MKAMSDLISTLADQIVALINTSPRSPTKAQIEEVLKPFMDTAVAHGARCRSVAQKCSHTWRPVQDAHGLFKQPVQECERCGTLSPV